MSDLMGYRIPKPTAWASRIVFDANAGLTLGDGSGIADVGTRHDGDFQKSTQCNWVKWRTGPTLVHCLQHDFSGSLEHGLNWVVLTREQPYGGVRPRANPSFHRASRVLQRAHTFPHEFSRLRRIALLQYQIS